MSSFVKQAINPKTNKKENALFLDDYYGLHHYGIGFSKDGKKITIKNAFDSGKLDYDKYDFYPEEDLVIENVVKKLTMKKEIEKILANAQEQKDRGYESETILESVLVHLFALINFKQ